jgi:hypothetical protein
MDIFRMFRFAKSGLTIHQMPVVGHETHRGCSVIQVKSQDTLLEI